MNRRHFIGVTLAAVPLISFGTGERKTEEDDVLAFKEVSGKLTRVVFEKLRKGDIAVFVQPDHGPVKGRWLVTSDPKPQTLDSGRRTWGIECKDIGPNPING